MWYDIRSGNKKRVIPHLLRYFCVSSRILWESKWLAAIFIAWDTIEFIFSASSCVSFSSCLCCLSRSRLERKSRPVSASWRTFSIFSIFFLASYRGRITACSYWPWNIFFHSAPLKTACWIQYLNPYLIFLVTPWTGGLRRHLLGIFYFALHSGVLFILSY